jgi:hypothetical protein
LGGDSRSALKGRSFRLARATAYAGNDIVPALQAFITLHDKIRTLFFADNFFENYLVDCYSCPLCQLNSSLLLPRWFDHICRTASIGIFLDHLLVQLIIAAIFIGDNANSSTSPYWRMIATSFTSLCGRCKWRPEDHGRL